MTPSLALKISAACSIGLGLFHVPFLFLGVEAARFFSAPRFILALIRQESPWLILIVAIIVAVFGVFGAYALSGAGVIRRLPGQRGALLAIASIYTLRGLLLVPQLVVMFRHPGVLAPQIPLFSLTALVVAAFHWAGLRSPRPTSRPTN